MGSLDIRTISERTGIGIRQIRYVLDHELVPPELLEEDEPTIAGRARTFDESAAAYVACTAYLMDLGFRSNVIPQLMKAICTPVSPRKGYLHLPEFRQIVVFSLDGRVQLADGRYVRWIIEGRVGDWFDFEKQQAVKGEFAPVGFLELNVGAINDAVQQRKNRPNPH